MIEHNRDRVASDVVLEALNRVEQMGYRLVPAEHDAELHHLYWDPGHPTEPRFIGTFVREGGDPGRWHFFEGE